MFRLEDFEAFKPEVYMREGLRDRKRRRMEDDMDWQPEASPAPSDGGGDEWRPSRADRAATRSRAAFEAANLSTAVPQVC